MENLSKHEMNVISLRDRNDVLKASDLFEKIGVKIFTEEKLKENFILKTDKDDDVKGSFLIKNSNEDGWRIQSHYIGFGIPVEELEEKINNADIINEIMSDEFKQLNEAMKNLKEQLTSIQDTIVSLDKKMEDLK